MNRVIAKSRRKYGGSEFKGIFPQNPADKTQMSPFDFSFLVWENWGGWYSSRHLSQRQRETEGDRGTLEHIFSLAGEHQGAEDSHWQSRQLALQSWNFTFTLCMTGKWSQSFLLLGNQWQCPARVISGAYPGLGADLGQPHRHSPLHSGKWDTKNSNIYFWCKKFGIGQINTIQK